MDEVKTISTDIFSVCSIPEIFEVILGKLEPRSIRISRQVCKLWDQSVISFTLRQKPPLPLPVIVLRDTKSLTQLLETLTNSTCPELIFRNLKSEGDQLENATFQQLLQEFGWILKSLEIEYSNQSFKLLRTILTEWCRNLEDIKIETFPSVTEFKKFYLEEGQLCHLKRLTFDSGGYSRCRSADVHILTTIVGASSNLKYLKIGSISGQQRMISESFRALKYYPRITEGLEEVWINCDWTLENNPLRNFLLISLSSNLKTLSLECRPPFPKTEISELLDKLKDSLEHLTLLAKTSQISASPNQLVSPGTRIRAPVMSNLKSFVNRGHKDGQLTLKEVTEKFPNLESLTLQPTRVNRYIEPVDEFFSYPDRTRGEFEDLEHTCLTNLTILGNIYGLPTGTVINRVFPNLRKLRVGVGFPSFVNRTEPDPALILMGMSLILSTLVSQNLKELTLDFGDFDWDLEYDEVELLNALQLVTMSPKLVKLTLISGRPTQVGPSFTNAIIGLVMESPKLRTLCLLKFKISSLESTRMIDATKGCLARLEFMDIDPNL